ncbi:hypothetical protein [Nocardia inohanensis]|uniref:hypothetical protein n=1 Tax=Nocardia inohanensis TaxID=209246 RepID=UPI00082C1942|nr:hypothetical protein [Nocardia inohanensis]
MLLDDFENKDNWEIAGTGAARTHLTTFMEGAPNKEPGVYADGVAGRDIRALVLLVRSATDEFEVELVRKPDAAFPIAGDLAAVNLWIRSPHAALLVHAHLRDAAGASRDVLLGKVSGEPEWKQLEAELPDPVTDAVLTGFTIRITEVVKTQGEVMILLDDLTARTRS